MALTKEARNRLNTFVQAAKRLLISDVEGQLQQYYGIRLDGTVLPAEQLTTPDTDQRYRAGLLRDRLTYLAGNIASAKDREKNIVQQLVREQAFTILNRFAALRMAEERGIIPETVRRGYNSEGYQVFDSVAGNSAGQFTRYTWYLNAVFDELALDLPAVFDRYSPYALLFPTEPALAKLFDLLNAEDIRAFRQTGRPAVNLWGEDETIGWMYQYYNADDERKQMREAQAPRNSRELAVRNQFFTPRYVVQFLTDNTLGRTWYDMTGGSTELAGRCRFMIREESLAQTPPAPKDPREIRLLDPACGSMHFGLYAFDLFEVIYREAWDSYPHLLGNLRDRMTRAEFIRHIPALILAHNIHGVDIDPRALQMAGLSLWLRAQRSFAGQGLAPTDRPAITRANLVLAEAMPGNAQLLSEIVKGLTRPMRRLVLHLWKQMQLAGELGVVLRIEGEIRQELDRMARDLEKEVIGKTQTDIGATDEEIAEAREAALFTSPAYREHFFENAEHEVLEHLRELAETATNGDAYQKLLFADDTTRGFAFIELCRQRYDVVVMNPPFGATSVATKAYVDSIYPDGKGDLAAVFVERMHEMLTENGLLGAISTRTIFFLGSYLEWRQKYIIHNTYLKYMADLGGGVLDAMVETAAYVMGRQDYPSSNFLRVTRPNADQKEQALLDAIRTGANQFIQRTSRFRAISNQPLCYWVDEKTLKLFETEDRFKDGVTRAADQGLATSDNPRFVRLHWENSFNLDFPPYQISEYSLRYCANTVSTVNWKLDGKELMFLYGDSGKIMSRPQSVDKYFHHGISWAYRTSSFQPYLVQRGGIFSHKRVLANISASTFSDKVLLSICSLWNSEYFDYLLKLSIEWITRPTFINGIINQSPYPALPKDLQTFLQSKLS
jgi:hypothetical protein